MTTNASLKYLFIAGLEHSGSTLLSHLLAQAPNVLSLGEVAEFFSPDHMKWYMSQWGNYSDARLCSCGLDWEECPFWGELFHLNGLRSNAPLVDKYRQLMEHVLRSCGESTLIVDSSKAPTILSLLLNAAPVLGFSRDSIRVAVAIKDVRNFTGSIARKTDRHSFIAAWRTFNWWFGRNRSLLAYMREESVAYDIVLYEQLCSNPSLYVNRVLERFGLHLEDRLEVSHTNSHIALGNKDFATRNRKRVKYDKRWLLEDQIGAVYLLHRKARRFNRSLYAQSLIPLTP